MVFAVLSSIALYAIPLVVTLRPIGTPVCDPDLWWHLRVGEWIVEHGKVPATDPFSAFGEGKKWVAYSWLYEVLIYGLHAAFGLTGIVIYRTGLALAITVAVQSLINRCRPSDLVSTGLTAACLLPLAMLFSERPWLFTILFGTLSLHAVLDLREGRDTLLPWLLPVIFVLWANVHIQFVYGLALLALACLAPLIDRRIESGDEGSAAALGSPGWRRLVVLAIACLLATLLNPYTYRLYGVVIEYATQPGPFQFVNELKALEFREPSDWAMLGLAGAAVFALGRRHRLCSFDVLLMAGCVVLSFRSRRDMWLTVLASASILSATFSSSLPVPAHRHRTARYDLAIGAAVCAIAIGLGWARGLSPSRLDKIAASVFPAAAADFVAKQGYTGPLFNDFNWGGYLIRTLPSLPVAIDGRTNLYGDERLVRFGNTWAGGPGWRDDPDLVSAGVIIADVRSPLASLLQCDGRFALVFEDDVARVFVARREAAR
jgi:hypothetical protein